MNAHLESSREFWREVLGAGGSTAIPRWAHHRRTGVAGHEATIPAGLAAVLRRLAVQLSVSASAVLLAAHAKVLAALSGEREVVTGYVAVEGRTPFPCRLTTEPDSWRALLFEARAEAAMLSHRDFPVDDLRREKGLTEPSFETVFDPAVGGGDDLAGGTVLRVGYSRQGARLAIQLRYRADVLDADCAPVLRHLTVAAGGRALGRWADPADRPRDGPGCRAVR